MKIYLLSSLFFLFIAGGMFAQNPLKSVSISHAMYYGSVRLQQVNLKGYLVIDHVHHDSAHLHSGHDHGCPVDSSFLGTYYRAVFGNASGMNFFDLIFRPDTVQRIYLAPSLNRETIYQELIRILRPVTDSLEGGTIPEMIETKNPEVCFTLHKQL